MPSTEARPATASGRHLAADYGLATAPGTTTGGGGWHRPVRWPGDRLPAKLKNGAGEHCGDVKRPGGYVALPGSIHPDTGTRYLADDALALNDLPTLAPVVARAITDTATPRVASSDTPVLVASRLPAPDDPRLAVWGERALGGAAGEVAGMAKGNRSNALNAAAYRLGRLSDACDIGEHEAATVLIGGATLACCVLVSRLGTQCVLRTHLEPVLPVLDLGHTQAVLTRHFLSRRLAFQDRHDHGSAALRRPTLHIVREIWSHRSPPPETAYHVGLLADL